MFYAEIQDGRQKWWENDFCAKTPIEYAGTLRVKNFVEKFLACFISKINTFYAKIQDGRLAAILNFCANAKTCLSQKWSKLE